MRATAELARSLRSERLEAPPPQVWQGVVDELGLDLRRDAADTTPVRSATRTRRGPLLWAAAAAVAGLVAGSVLTWAVSDDDPAPVATPEVVRTARLEPLATGAGGTGRAELLEDTDGRQSVRVDAEGLGRAGGHFEVWLIKPDTTQMVSLGVLDGGERGDFVVPATAVADGYTLVDVSDEPDDGQPTHSGDSVLRGDLAG